MLNYNGILSKRSISLMLILSFLLPYVAAANETTSGESLNTQTQVIYFDGQTCSQSYFSFIESKKGKRETRALIGALAGAASGVAVGGTSGYLASDDAGSSITGISAIAGGILGLLAGAAIGSATTPGPSEEEEQQILQAPLAISLIKSASDLLINGSVPNNSPFQTLIKNEQSFLKNKFEVATLILEGNREKTYCQDGVHEPKSALQNIRDFVIKRLSEDEIQ